MRRSSGVADAISLNKLILKGKMAQRGAWAGERIARYPATLTLVYGPIKQSPFRRMPGEL